jgi:hypothetical protein
MSGQATLDSYGRVGNMAPPLRAFEFAQLVGTKPHREIPPDAKESP